MSFIDKMKSFIGADEEYEDEMGFEKKEKPQEEEIDAEPFNYDAPVASNSKKNNKVVNIHATTQLQVVLVKPERFDDASSVADHLNDKRTVVLNLESTNKDVARRLVDFLSGVAYANNGQIKRVAASTFIITPYNVDIVGDLLDELENNGVYF
ncbi:MAG: cell division protein SepF [Clostridiales bacterium]|nr:cell division protein SepF [Clostridiales bacterium]